MATIGGVHSAIYVLKYTMAREKIPSRIVYRLRSLAFVNIHGLKSIIVIVAIVVVVFVIHRRHSCRHHRSSHLRCHLRVDGNFHWQYLIERPFNFQYMLKKNVSKHLTGILNSSSDKTNKCAGNFSITKHCVSNADAFFSL